MRALPLRWAKAPCGRTRQGPRRATRGSGSVEALGDIHETSPPKLTGRATIDDFFDACARPPDGPALRGAGLVGKSARAWRDHTRAITSSRRTRSLRRSGTRRCTRSCRRTCIAPPSRRRTRTWTFRNDTRSCSVRSWPCLLSKGRVHRVLAWKTQRTAAHYEKKIGPGARSRKCAKGGATFRRRCSPSSRAWRRCRTSGRPVFGALRAHGRRVRRRCSR